MTTKQTRPALPTLQRDQRALLDPDADDDVRHGLRAGFPTRRALIDWYQRAIVRTFGAITDEWPPADLLRDRTLLGRCLTGPEADRYASGEITPESAYRYRLKLESAIVLPACKQAYNDLRTRAGEYVDGSDDPARDLDPDDQEYVAMRPAFQVADRQQSAALRQLWGGFETLETLQSWLHDLNEPTNGTLDDGLPAAVGRDPTAQQYLLAERADPRRARLYRERFAISILLPAFAAGIERMEAGELATKTGGGLTAAQG